MWNSVDEISFFTLNFLLVAKKHNILVYLVNCCKKCICGWVSNNDGILSGQITAVSLLVQNLPPKNLMQRELFVKLIHHAKCQNPVPARPIWQDLELVPLSLCPGTMKNFLSLLSLETKMSHHVGNPTF